MTQQQSRIAEWATARPLVNGMLFPALLTAIVLGAVATLGYWWLWPIVIAIAVPALVILFAPSQDRLRDDGAAMHLR